MCVLFFCLGFAFVCFGFGFVLLLDGCWYWTVVGVVLFFCFSCLILFFGGFKGQVRWPPHLALNPPCFFLCFPLFGFFSLLYIEKPAFPPPLKKAVLVVHFSVFPCVPL